MRRGPFSLFRHNVLTRYDSYSVMMHCIVRKPPCELNIFCDLTTIESRVNILY